MFNTTVTRANATGGRYVPRKPDESGLHALQPFAKPKGLDLVTASTKVKGEVNDVNYIPVAEMTLAPRREYMPNVIDVDKDVVKLKDEYKSVKLSGSEMEFTFKHAQVVGVMILSTVKFHAPLALTTRTNTRDPLKLLCLISGCDITKMNDEDRIKVNGLIMHSYLAFMDKFNVLLEAYMAMMNDPNLTYLQNRRYFPPALKDMVDSRYVEDHYPGYWNHLFKSSNFSPKALLMDFMNWSNPAAMVYALCFFHPEKDSNLQAFRTEYQNQMDLGAAALLVVKVKRENLTFPDNHRRFGANANKKHIYTMALNAWEEYTRAERQKQLMF